MNNFVNPSYLEAAKSPEKIKEWRYILDTKGYLRLKNFIKKAAEYLYQEDVCSEDKIRHNGRRSYLWSLLLWLDKNNVSGPWKEMSLKSLEQISSFIKKNPTGMTVIFPGLHHRYNYSTNAIDCGILMDSFFDLKKIVPEEISEKEELFNKVAEEYLSSKIGSLKGSHNRYLWAGTGLARWVAENREHEKSPDYIKSLQVAIDNWLGVNDDFGFHPYTSDEVFLNGITTYYHSRCLAFVFYIKELIPEIRVDEEALLKAGQFLARMYKPTGVKELRLDTKRYYFTGDYEVGSHSFDIYVFWKLHSLTNDDFWLDIASISWQRLYEGQSVTGAINSCKGDNNYDWQCPLMRTGHVAWLTKISNNFLEKIDYRNVKLLIAPNWFFDQNNIKNRLLIIGSKSNWHHFVVKKSKLNGFNGQDHIGLIGLPIYKKLANPFKSGISTKLLKTNLVFIFLHCKDILFNKRDPLKSLKFFYKYFLKFAYQFFFIKSSNFLLEVENIQLSDNNLKHDLLVSDASGKRKIKIGERFIKWNYYDADSFSFKDSLNKKNCRDS